ncbi:MAG: hypothetical protein AB1540_13080 [Bdellovibrionota bacterium]
MLVLVNLGKWSENAFDAASTPIQVMEGKRLIEAYGAGKLVNMSPFQISQTKEGPRKGRRCIDGLCVNLNDGAGLFNQLEARKLRWKSEVGEVFEWSDVVDVFVFDHSNDYYFMFGSLDQKHMRKLRLVYTAGCDDFQDATSWHDMGAKVVVGHRGTSISPLFYWSFSKGWLEGQRADRAVADSNAWTQQALDDGPLARFAVRTLGSITDDSEEAFREGTMANWSGEGFLDICSSVENVNPSPGVERPRSSFLTHFLRESPSIESEFGLRRPPSGDFSNVREQVFGARALCVGE